MAVLRLDSYDRNEVDLPEVCMQCGAPAALRKSKTFSWFPPWVYIVLVVCNILIFAIVAMIMTKRRTVDVPLCEQHKNHWLRRQLLVLGSFLGVLAIGFVAMMVSSDNGGGNDNPLGGIMCVGSVILLVAWVILAVIVQSTSIRPKEITDQGIALQGVSKAFVEAYEEEWRVAPERLDEVARERWNKGGRAPRPGRRVIEDDGRIQPAEEDEGRKPSPDTFQEGAP
ncbi:MAG TPA: hypothetical protein VMG10_12470 [Gemmataceae bacterium]|nr:hypothetical protein [Gemmataceae bacterium]